MPIYGHILTTHPCRNTTDVRAPFCQGNKAEYTTKEDMDRAKEERLDSLKKLLENVERGMFMRGLCL